MHTTSGGRVAWQSTSDGENSYSHWAARRRRGRAARAQQPAMPVVGFVNAGSPRPPFGLPNGSGFVDSMASGVESFMQIDLREYVKLSVISTVVWTVCEVTVGLFFLMLGQRLWEYYKYPVAFGFTSPIVWALAFLLIPPAFLACLFLERKFALGVWPAWALRTFFCCTLGTSIELIVSAIYLSAFGSPLYLYTYLPTFGGWGSWLSPLYYATLLVHFPVEEWLAARRNSPRSGQIPPAAQSTEEEIQQQCPERFFAAVHESQSGRYCCKVAERTLWNRNLKQSNRDVRAFESMLRIRARS
jgi:hypothetical protein